MSGLIQLGIRRNGLRKKRHQTKRTQVEYRVAPPPGDVTRTRLIDGKRSERRLRRLIKSSEPQRWLRPRAQGVHPEAVSKLRVLKSKSVGKTGIKSTLHKAYTGPLPDADVLASGAKLSQINPKPLLAHILEGMSKVELVPSQVLYLMAVHFHTNVPL